MSIDLTRQMPATLVQPPGRETPGDGQRHLITACSIANWWQHCQFVAFQSSPAVASPH